MNMSDSIVTGVARLLRLRTIKKYRQQGQITREQALDLLDGPLTPGDETTYYNDANLLDANEATIQAWTKSLGFDFYETK